MKKKRNNQEEFEVPSRLQSLDFLRGFSIVVAVIFIHTSADFLSQDWAWVNNLYFPFADFFGSLFFVFISSNAVVFSIKKKEGRIPDQVIRNRTIARGLSIMSIGAVSNIYFNIIYSVDIYSPIPFPLSLWGWNILFFIGFSQIVTYYSYKWGKNINLILGILVIFIGVPLREFIYVYNLELVEQSSFNLPFFLLHYIITSPIPQMPLIPCIGVTFFSTLFGEILYSNMEKGEKRNFTNLLKSLLVIAIAILIFSMILGGRILTPGPITSEVYAGVNSIKSINKQTLIPGFFLIGFPAFLVRGTISHTTFAVGFSLLCLVIGIYSLDFKKRHNLPVRFFNFYGKNSLSYFLFVFYFNFAFRRFLNLYIYFLYYFGFVSLLGLVMYIWRRYSKNALLTPEWMVGQVCIIVTNQTYKRLDRKKKKEIKSSSVK